MIPILPCRSIDETLAFYTALGFEITYQQKRPNTAAGVKYEDINLQFFTLKGYEPKDSYSTCVVLVPNLAALHEIFCNALRSRTGKLPVAGIPRISKLNSSNSAKQLRFNIIDPGGNWIRFVQHGEAAVENESAEQEEAAPGNTAQTRLARATSAADWLVEAKGDYAAAAEMLDKALAQPDSVAPTDRVRALVLRASLAVQMDDRALAAKLLSEARQTVLEPQEREALAAPFEQADDLETLLG
jgi:catechol 2,3-dioxygenase-like lactoylglutathione lyase family enzyme